MSRSEEDLQKMRTAVIWDASRTLQKGKAGLAACRSIFKEPIQGRNCVVDTHVEKGLL